MPSDAIRELTQLLDHYSPAYLTEALTTACADQGEPLEVQIVLTDAARRLRALEKI